MNQQRLLKRYRNPREKQREKALPEATKLADKVASSKLKKITPEFSEQSRIVPLGSPEAQNFQKFMELLIKRLFPKIDLKRRPINFVISDDPTINAFCIPSFRPILIGFNKGLLDKLDM